MAEEIEIPQSLVEQTLDEMFSMLEKREEFDAPTIETLKALAKSGELKKVPQVTKAIKVA
jgi:hypothetical protein